MYTLATTFLRFSILGGQACVGVAYRLDHTKLILCFTDPAGSLFVKIETKNVKMQLICTRNPASLSGLRAFVASSKNYRTASDERARRPRNEAKHSPRGKIGGWRAVLFFLPAYRVMFLT